MAGDDIVELGLAAGVGLLAVLCSILKCRMDWQEDEIKSLGERIRRLEGEDSR